MSRDLNAVIMPGGSLQLEWSQTEDIINKSQQRLQDEIFKRFIKNQDSSLLFLGFCDKSVQLSASLDYLRKIAKVFTKKLIQTPDLNTLRHRVNLSFEEEDINEILDLSPLMTGAEYLDKSLIENCWIRMKNRFQFEISEFEGQVVDFIKAYSPDVHLVGRVFFHLVENKDEAYPFAFLATYSTGFGKHGNSKHLPLKYALVEYENNSEKLLDLLSTVHIAAKESSLISKLIEDGELFQPIAWAADEAFMFLKEVPIYEKAGILCRIPDWWKKRASGLRVNISIGNKKPSFVGMDALLNFNLKLMLGDTQISIEEARKLLQSSEGLAFIKNKWVVVDPEKLAQTLNAYERAQELAESGALNLRDALRLQFNPQKMFGIEYEDESISVSNGKWLESVLQKLANPGLIPSIKPGRAFKSVLRKYQQKGLDWLYFLHFLGFGSCLADDMGLGKTIELLAFLDVLKNSGKRDTKNNYFVSLLIIPASLISNWTNEIDRFFPELEYYVAHPGFKKINARNKLLSDDKNLLDKVDIVITTYTLVQKYEWLRKRSWNYIILDEAQAIKNPTTKQTRAIKKLNSRNKIIMTGTPIENRLLDLWSLFDFLNPGLLGNIKEFSEFSRNLQDRKNGYARLRNLVNPYILRRLKTDKSVISDLPEKVEMKSYADLSKKQILLYKEIVQKLQESINNSKGIQRKGIILASIMKFKQLCNHPDQYLGTGNYEEVHSGKFSRLREICETIYEKRERVLVFTQFKEIIAPLKEFLERIFLKKGLVLHGSVPVSKRKKIIEDFQGNEYVPFIVLSLKAGGVGLNLTRANHVIHFDRWWNPAVENQATDRAFRIGQKNNVIVHKFLTKGTIEEKIDEMLTEKATLSQEVVQASCESLITEMNNKEIMDIFKLSL